jgi:ribonuclease HII
MTGAQQNATEPSRFHFERECLRQGLTRVAGVDEAGRGPLAGPVVAAAVVFPRDWIERALPLDLAGLNDSKQLTAARRELFFRVLTQQPALQYAIAQMEADLIDQLNILQATHRAMNQALLALQPPPQHVLVDGLRVNTLAFPQTPLVKGDSRSYSIAAASVLAKVTRDRLMEQYDRVYPQYGFAQHKGYPTPGHIAALARHGPCPIHRRSFSPVQPAQPELF